jgi:hypothetical protein
LKKRWHDDEFAEPLAIKPVRAPRQENAPLPVGGEETIASLEKLTRLLRDNADPKRVQVALGEVRGHLNFIREQWKLNSSAAAEAADRVTVQLNKKHGASATRFSKVHGNTLQERRAASELEFLRRELELERSQERQRRRGWFSR